MTTTSTSPAPETRRAHAARSLVRSLPLRRLGSERARLRGAVGAQPPTLIRGLDLLRGDRHRRLHGRAVVRLRARPGALARALSPATRLCGGGGGDRALRARVPDAACGGRCPVPAFRWIIDGTNGACRRVVARAYGPDGTDAAGRLALARRRHRRRTRGGGVAGCQHVRRRDRYARYSLGLDSPLRRGSDERARRLAESRRRARRPRALAPRAAERGPQRICLHDPRAGT